MEFETYVSQVLRIPKTLKALPDLEVEWVVGPIPIEAQYIQYDSWLLEPSCCKKWQKKSQTRNWLGEQGRSERSELYQIGPK